MHAKTDSEGTSVEASWPPRSPPLRPVYYVQSPSNHDLEKMSCGSSPMASNHCSPIHHSRESPTSRFSASLKNPRNLPAWKQFHEHRDGDDDDCDGDRIDGQNFRLYLCIFLGFVLLFVVFCLILWAAARSYKPKISVKHAAFERFNLQAGNDASGVPTDMLSLNSTVRISYMNTGTFYAVHVSSTPWELHYFQIKIASGQMRKFTQPRKSQRTAVTVVQGHQVPLYGGIPVLVSEREHLEEAAVPLNLTFVMRSRAYILGRLVNTRFYSRVRCSVTLHGNRLGQRLNLNDSCTYQ